MLDYICSQQPKVLHSSKLMEKELIFSSKTYIAMIKFLMKCFETCYRSYSSEAGVNESDSPLVKMCLLLEHAMGFEGSAELHATASKALVELGFRFPKVIHLLYAVILWRLPSPLSWTWNSICFSLVLAVDSLTVYRACIMAKDFTW